MAANTTPPKISSSGCASKAISAIPTASPNQMLARFSSCRTNGSRSSLGPGVSACLTDPSE